MLSANSIQLHSTGMTFPTLLQPGSGGGGDVDSPERPENPVSGVELAAGHKEDGALGNDKEEQHKGEAGAGADEVEQAPAQKSAQHLVVQW
jgi:hypothetical protein